MLLRTVKRIILCGNIHISYALAGLNTCLPSTMIQVLFQRKVLPETFTSNFFE